MEPWMTIEHGRAALADYLGGLSPADWAKPSLCTGWTVKDVAAHLLVVPTVPKGRVFRSFVGAGFDLDKMNARWVERFTSTMSTDDIVAATRSSAASRALPPGVKLLGALTELTVHAADIADGAGVPFVLPVGNYLAALDHLKHVQPVFKAKARIAGLTLRATDADWTTGEGPTVSGSARDLLLAVTGRPSVLGRLSGDGVATMRSR